VDRRTRKGPIFDSQSSIMMSKRTIQSLIMGVLIGAAVGVGVYTCDRSSADNVTSSTTSKGRRND
jgi:hypothetical protein